MNNGNAQSLNNDNKEGNRNNCNCFKNYTINNMDKNIRSSKTFTETIEK